MVVLELTVGIQHEEMEVQVIAIDLRMVHESGHKSHGRTTITPRIVAMDSMSDEEMASKAFVLRRRAEHGDLAALKLAEKLEAELRARLGPTPSAQMPLAQLPKPRSRWRFW